MIIITAIQYGNKPPVLNIQINSGRAKFRNDSQENQRNKS